MTSRVRGPAAVLLPVLLASLMAGCTEARTGDSSPDPAGPSWATAPATTGGIVSVATSDRDGFRLHTASGDKTFVPGMNLGSTTPTHQPGELAMGAADYRRWFAQMGEMGVGGGRLDTIQTPPV